MHGTVVYFESLGSVHDISNETLYRSSIFGDTFLIFILWKGLAVNQNDLTEVIIYIM